MTNYNCNKFNIKGASDKINIFKDVGDACVNIQDKAMDIYDKHVKGSNKLLDKYIEERDRIIQERDKELEKLDNIEDLDERLNKKDKIEYKYNNKLDNIEKKIRESDNSKIEFGNRAVEIAVKAAVVAIGIGVGAGVKKLLDNRKDNSVNYNVIEETTDYNVFDEE